MDESTKLLIELRLAYMWDVDDNGQPNMEILDLCNLWERVNNRIGKIRDPKPS